jgi:hypothetical protein
MSTITMAMAGETRAPPALVTRVNLIRACTEDGAEEKERDE